MDYPFARYHKPTIGSLSLEAAGMSLKASAAGNLLSGAYPTANLAIYVPFALAAPYLVQKFWWCNGSAVAGNVDCGIYTGDGTLLANAGSTAQAGTSTLQSVAIGTPFLLLPGSYYMALSCSSVSAAFLRAQPVAALCKQMGLAQQATAVPLPATFTLATAANAYLPLFGIASASVI